MESYYIYNEAGEFQEVIQAENVEQVRILLDNENHSGWRFELVTDESA